MAHTEDPRSEIFVRETGLALVRSVFYATQSRATHLMVLIVAICRGQQRNCLFRSERLDGPEIQLEKWPSTVATGTNETCGTGLANSDSNFLKVIKAFSGVRR